MSQVPAGLAYHEVHRGGPVAGRHAWWRPVIGTTALIALMLVVAPVFWQLPFAAYYAVTGQPVVDSVSRLLELDDPTPAGLAYLNLVLASAIPVTWLITRVLHGLRPRWLASVTPRIRWGWLLTCMAIAFGALIVTLVVSAALPSAGDGTEVSGGVNDFTRTTRDFLLVLVLLTPLQAAGEEYAFRGYLTQAFGGLFGNRWVAVVGPALLFALAHGSQSAPVFFDRFAFGLVAGVLVILTGGLEAGIAMHVLNNLLAFGLALAYGDMASTLNPTGGSWWSIPVTLTQSLVFLGLVLLAARRRGLETRTGEVVLAAPSPRV
ncbi:CPBP family intramembrane metalloprotease [Nocardioides sp. KIGAM211]|uniref:CPBP family intramembrane metalloprotease n=1 Tax=Nocardioides luti TaxID=2761101 RepID=A0A7X0RE70_9ACTN|nr:type II CAAX endopeptidase family protein [Nocardioides luti]MBB6626612.1 CPBP family intramembrane metalloprotease [Nocardioides luti]